MNFIFLTFINVWTHWVPCKVNVTTFGRHLLCMRPEVHHVNVDGTHCAYTQMNTRQMEFISSITVWSNLSMLWFLSINDEPWFFFFLSFMDKQFVVVFSTPTFESRSTSEVTLNLLLLFHEYSVALWLLSIVCIKTTKTRKQWSFEQYSRHYIMSINIHVDDSWAIFVYVWDFRAQSTLSRPCRTGQFKKSTLAGFVSG